MSESIEEMLRGAALAEEYGRVKAYAWKMVWRKHWAKLLPPAMMVVAGLLAGWWWVPFWGTLWAFTSVDAAWAVCMGRIFVHRSIKASAQAAVGLAFVSDVPVPADIQKVADGPEFPPESDF